MTTYALVQGTNFVLTTSEGNASDLAARVKGWMAKGEVVSLTFPGHQPTPLTLLLKFGDTPVLVTETEQNEGQLEKAGMKLPAVSISIDGIE